MPQECISRETKQHPEVGGVGFDGADDIRAAALTREGQGESGPHTGFCGMGHRELTVLHQESSQMRWDTDDVTVAWVRLWENQIL